MGILHKKRTAVVGGTDWNDDHAHVPFEVAMFLASGNTPAAGVASAAAGTEMWATAKGTRNRIDLSTAVECRLVAMVTTLGNAAAAAIKLQYMPTNVATWAGTDMASSTPNLVVGAGTVGTLFDTGWRPLAAGAKVDNLNIACAVAVAFGTTPPQFGSITAFFR